MVKHTQTIRREFGNEWFECVWPFCGIGAYRVNIEDMQKDVLKLNKNKESHWLYVCATKLFGYYSG